jgi:hypothetical protein
VSAAAEQLLVLAVREFQQARMSMEQASVMLDMVRATLDPDALARVDEAVQEDPADDEGQDDGDAAVCPIDGCGEELSSVAVFGGLTFLCPEHGEIATDA